MLLIAHNLSESSHTIFADGSLPDAGSIQQDVTAAQEPEDQPHGP